MTSSITEPPRKSPTITKMNVKSTPAKRLISAVSGYTLASRFVLERNRLAQPSHPVADELSKNLSLTQTSLESLIASKKSLIRWGDGDSMSALGLGNSFEPPSAHLAFELRQILKRASNESGPLLGLPLTFLLPETRKQIHHRRLRPWGLTLLLLHKAIKTPLDVFDSFMFRDMKGAPRLSPLLSLTELFECLGDRKIIAIGPRSTFNAIENQAQGKLVESIAVSETRCFSEIDHLTEETESKLSANRGAVALVSAGPVGRILIGRLHETGQLLDVGQISGRSLGSTAVVVV